MARYLYLNVQTDHPSRKTWITSWQAFLRTEGVFPHDNWPAFRSKSYRATEDFQREQGLQVDGVVGSVTVRRALELGFDPPGSWWDVLVKNKDAHPVSIPAGANEEPPGWMDPTWPRPQDLDGDGRADLSYVGREERARMFGEFAYRAAPGNKNGEIVILGDWVRRNIVRVVIPALAHLVPRGVYLHRKVAAQFAGAFQEAVEAGLGHLIKTFGGTFYPRFIRGSTRTLSNHSFGAAIDLNAEWNGLGKRPALVGQEGSLRQLATIFEKWGIFWGGWYRSRKDGMHFEAVRVLSVATIQELSRELVNPQSVEEALAFRTAA